MHKERIANNQTCTAYSPDATAKTQSTTARQIKCLISVNQSVTRAFYSTLQNVGGKLSVSVNRRRNKIRLPTAMTIDWCPVCACACACVCGWVRARELITVHLRLLHKCVCISQCSKYKLLLLGVFFTKC